MKVELNKKQVSMLQYVLVDNYIDSKLQDETTPGTIEKSWYLKLRALALNLQKQTQVPSEIEDERHHWLTQKQIDKEREKETGKENKI